MCDKRSPVTSLLDEGAYDLDLHMQVTRLFDDADDLATQYVRSKDVHMHNLHAARREAFREVLHLMERR